MKKILLLLFVFTLVSISAFSMDILNFPPPIDKGDLLVNAGIGFGTFGSRNWNMRIPPLAASLEYCLPVELPISVGGMFSFFSYGWDRPGGDSWTYNFMVFAARGNWHWNFDVSWLDFYTGLSLGYQHFTERYSGPDSVWANNFYSWNYSGLYWATQAGARFFFTDKIGAFAELGHPVWLKAGVTFKF